MASYETFEELDCYKKCRLVRQWVEQFIISHISKSDYDMIQNIRRAGRSTTRNLAEGFGRFHFKENIQYCRISRGSLFEIKEDLNISFDEGKANKEDIQEGLMLVNNAIHSVNGYIGYLKSRISNK